MLHPDGADWPTSELLLPSTGSLHAASMLQGVAVPPRKSAGTSRNGT